MSTVSPQQFAQTKERIRTLVGEIAQLSKQELDDEAYYAEVVQRVVAALAAVGGAVWTAGEGGRAKLAYQMNVPEKLIDRDSEEGLRHYALLDQSLRGGQPALVPPLSGTEDKKGPGNPTRCLLLMGPLKADDHVEGVIEIFQRPNTAVEAQRGYLQFVLQICEMVGEWLKSRRLKHFGERQSLWSQADEFSSLVHESLDLNQTAFTIANEGRRLIECDRVSVAIGDGSYCYIEAVSGQDTPDNRSNVITMLSDLATRVVATGEPLWYEGETDDLPPQIEESLRTYVDETHTKAIAVLPLHRTADTSQLTDEEKSKEKTLGPVIGAVIIEQIEDTRPREILENRVDQVRRHSALALANSLDHSNVFLMPLWRWIGQQLWIFHMRTLPKTIAIVALVVAAIVALWIVPWDLWVEGDGKIQPVSRKEVFTSQNGTITDVFVEHGSRVIRGQKLLKMRDPDLEMKYLDTVGQVQATKERIHSIMKLLLQELKADERNKLAGEKAELIEKLAGLERQKKLLEEKQAELTIYSPIDGIVTTWNVKENLLQRPVQRGQALLTVADPSDLDTPQIAAKQSGTVTEMFAKADSMVFRGDKLMQLKNPAIEQEYDAARKAVEASQAQIDPIVKALDDPSLPANEREQLKAQLAELDVRHSELVAAETEAERKFRDLTVTSPVSGLVTALDATLLNKQVEPGQQLATVKASKWEVELILPESNVGHVTLAQARETEGGGTEHLPASFVMQTEPGTYYYGWLREVEKAAQVYEDQVHGVKTHITLNPDAQPADRRPGASAKVSINCGRHSVGYVLFHKAIEWVQINVFF